jgi:integrase
MDRKRAQAVANQYERVAQRIGNPQRVRETFAEFYKDHYGEDLPVATVRVYSEKWLAARKPELACATYLRYEKAVEKFIKFLNGDADRDLGEITKARIAAFRDTHAAKTSPANANVDLKVLKVAFRAARLDGYLWQDPAEGVKTLKTHDRDFRRPFTIPELKLILAVADDEWKSLIKFGLYTGQRLADIALLRWEQIDFDRDEIRFIVRKTGKKLVVPIAGPLREHLLTLPTSDKPSAPVHPRAASIVNSQNGRVGTLSNAFGELLAQAGLRTPLAKESTGRGRANTRKGMEVSFHSIRHTSVSLLKDAGIPDAVVMAIVGHSSAAMSRRYTHVGKESLAKAAAALPEL